jgi:hypothetical protein
MDAERGGCEHASKQIDEKSDSSHRIKQTSSTICVVYAPHLSLSRYTAAHKIIIKSYTYDHIKIQPINALYVKENENQKYTSTNVGLHLLDARVLVDRAFVGARSLRADFHMHGHRPWQ